MRNNIARSQFPGTGLVRLDGHNPWLIHEIRGVPVIHWFLSVVIAFVLGAVWF